jgi:hypothetical protein
MSMEHSWNNTGRGRCQVVKHSENNLSQGHFVNHQSHTVWPEIEAGPPHWQAEPGTACTVQQDVPNQRPFQSGGKFTGRSHNVLLPIALWQQAGLNTHTKSSRAFFAVFEAYRPPAGDLWPYVKLRLWWLRTVNAGQDAGGSNQKLEFKKNAQQFNR